MSRIVSFILENKNAKDNVLSAVSKVSSLSVFDEIYVFSSIGCANDFVGIKCNFQEIPDEYKETRAKRKNYATSFFKNASFKGFLHVIEDNVEFVGDLSNYVEKIEHTMDVLDYDVYFSTITDGCNYVYSKFNPRISISIDYPEFKNLGLPERISFTSNANTAYVIYNYAKIQDDLLKFDDRFDVAMFFIIEYLARRRNTKPQGSLYYMNQYLSIPEEIGVFKYDNSLQIQVSQDRMAIEDKLFKESNVNFTPDNNIDEILQSVYEKLKSKV